MIPLAPTVYCVLNHGYLREKHRHRIKENPQKNLHDLDTFLKIKTFQATSELSKAIGKMLPRNPSEPLRRLAIDSTYHSIASGRSPSRNTLATSDKPILFLQVIITES